MKLLLVEDDRNMAAAICELLRQEHYLTDVCYDGQNGEDQLLSGNYDAAVLDVMLPGRDGYAIAQKARAAGIATPILFLTARGSTADKVAGLDAGGDDYLTKPFETEELLARVRALLRRRGQELRRDELVYGDLTLDRKEISLFCQRSGMSVRLSEKEYHILELFFENPGRVLTKEQLAVRIWGYENEAEYNKVEVYVSFTRRKLQYIESQTEIKAVRGLGYQMRENHV
mgnify:CR=1 FL=1